MLVRYYGHSLFTIALESGLTILTDPYGTFYDYPVRNIDADIVTVSHQHHDHNAVSMVRGTPVVLDSVGVFHPAKDVRITGIASKHDSQGGALRGDNIIFVIEAEGLRLVHLGDLGHRLTQQQCNEIGKTDVLMVPIGGTYTTDAQEAYHNINLLKPRVTIPMHYRTPYSEDMPITTEGDFLALAGVVPDPMPLCRLTAGDIGERPAYILLSVTA